MPPLPGRRPVPPLAVNLWRIWHEEFGMSYRAISRAVGRSDSVVRYHLSKDQAKAHKDRDWCRYHWSQETRERKIRLVTRRRHGNQTVLP